MPRCLIEVDVMIAMCEHPATLGHVERMLTDPEWQRVLGGPCPRTSRPEHVFEALIELLALAEHPDAADDTTIAATRDGARGATRVWFNEAVAGQRHEELSPWDCWALFRLIRQIERTVTAAVEAHRLAALGAVWDDADLAEIEPAPVRVEA